MGLKTAALRQLPLSNEAFLPLDQFYKIWKASQLVNKTYRYAVQRFHLEVDCTHTVADSYGYTASNPSTSSFSIAGRTYQQAFSPPLDNRAHVIDMPDSLYF